MDTNAVRTELEREDIGNDDTYSKMLQERLVALEMSEINNAAANPSAGVGGVDHELTAQPTPLPPN